MLVDHQLHVVNDLVLPVLSNVILDKLANFIT